jgi:drug/metabolite transporter (DMT)-like permease
MTLVRSMGLILGLAGVAVLLTSGDSGLTEGGRPMLAGVYALIAVLSIAAGGVYAKQYAGQYRPTEVVGIHFVSGSIVIATTTLIIEGAPAGLTGNAWALIVYMALGSTVLPFILYYWMIRTVSATFASMAGYLVTLIAVIAGMVFLDERLQPGILIGGVLILVGVVIGERAERAARRSIPVEEALGH